MNKVFCLFSNLAHGGHWLMFSNYVLMCIATNSVLVVNLMVDVNSKEQYLFTDNTEYLE